jgi:hypothetical protein
MCLYADITFILSILVCEWAYQSHYDFFREPFGVDYSFSKNKYCFIFYVNQALS